MRYLIILPLCALAHPVAAQRQARGPTVPGVVAAIGGSFAGVEGGRWLGGQLSEALGIDQGGEDPGLTLQILGAGAGSVLVTALAADFGDALMGRPPIPLGDRIRDAGVGMLLGLATGYLSAKAVDRYGGDTGKAWRIGYSTTQGLYAGLSNGRW